MEEDGGEKIEEEEEKEVLVEKGEGVKEDGREVEVYERGLQAGTHD